MSVLFRPWSRPIASLGRALSSKPFQTLQSLAHHRPWSGLRLRLKGSVAQSRSLALPAISHAESSSSIGNAPMSLTSRIAGLVPKLGNKSRSHPWLLRRSSSHRYRRSGWTPETLIYSLIALNSAVFLAWQYAKYRYHEKRDPSALNYMVQNFLSGLRSMAEGHYWTLVTSAFSHSDLIHFGINMFVLYSFGPTVIGIVGMPNFLGFYLGSAVVSSVCSLAYQYYASPYSRRAIDGSHGASGAITATTLVYAITYPRVPILLYGIVPVPSWLAIGGFIAYDILRSVRGTSGQVDTAGHLGGAAAGALYWLLRLRR